MRVARYLEIRNAAGNMIVDDETRNIQILALTKVLEFSNPTQNNINTTDGWKPLAPFTKEPILDKFNDLRGFVDHMLPSQPKVDVYRVFGDIGDLPYAFITGGAYNYQDGITTHKVFVNSMSNTPFQYQCAWLKLDPINIARPDSALITYNENGEITFDSALGYVHHIATKTAKFNVTSSGDFSVQMADISGLGVDVSKLFLRCETVPAVSQWQWGSSSNFYRVGYRSFIPRLRVTNGVIYVDFKRWMPYNYTGSIAEIYRPKYSLSVYYIPAVRSF